MRSGAALLVLLLVVLGDGACASPPPCGGEAGAVPDDACIAVLRTDYLSSAITFADCDGHLLMPSWIDSGTVVSSLVTSVSADVVLVAAPGGLGWIDRSIDTLTVATLEPGAMPTFFQDDVRFGATGAIANPHDVAWLDAGRALLTRYGGAPGVDGGAASDDVVLLEGGVLVQRIEPDLARTTVTVGGRSVRIHARPDALLLLGDPPTHAVVSLNRTSDDFITFAEAMVGVIALDDAPSFDAYVTLPDLRNCGALRRDPLRSDRAILLCAGPYRAPREERRPFAGLVELTLREGTLEVSGTVSVPAPFAVPGQGLLALGDRRALVVGTGSAAETSVPDELLEVSFETGAVRVVQATRGGFVLGEGVLVPATGRVLVPDAEAGAIWVLDPASPVTLLETVAVDDCIELPPRQLRALDR